MKICMLSELFPLPGCPSGVWDWDNAISREAVNFYGKIFHDPF